MERNVCGLDRALRLVAGTALLAAATLGPDGRDRRRTIPSWRILGAYAAAELLVTGLVQWCPMNHVLGIDTCGGDPRTAVRSRVRSVLPT